MTVSVLKAVYVKNLALLDCTLHNTCKADCSADCRIENVFENGSSWFSGALQSSRILNAAEYYSQESKCDGTVYIDMAGNVYFAR